MDPLTNSLAAFTLARTGLGRLLPRGDLVMIAAVNLPDLDVLSLLASPAYLLTGVGGPLHSVAAAPVLAAAFAAGLWLLSRRTLSLIRLFVLSLAALALRLVVDLMPVYGVQLLYPFSDAWFRAGILPYMDPWLLCLLLTFAFWPLLSHLVNVEMGIRKTAGQGLAVATLLLAGVYCGYRAGNIAEALSVVPNHSYGGEVPLREACYPNQYSLARVHCVLETDTGMVEVDYFPGDSYDATEARILKKTTRPQGQLAQYQSEWFRQLEPRLRMPYWTVYPAGIPADANEAILSDLWLAPEPYPIFRLRVLLDSQDRVLEESIRIELWDWKQMEAVRQP